MVLLQPDRKPSPRAGVALQGARTFAVSFEVLGYPGVPPAAANCTGVTVEFLGFELGAQGASLDGLSRIVRP